MANGKYSQAGVDIDKGNEAVRRIKAMVGKMGPTEIGKFGGFFPLKSKMKEPILVSSTDGVGTKLKVAFLAGIHNTVGKDLVNHCVNDILVYGAQPLFFLDYVATGRLDPEVVAAVVSGVLDGCMENGFVLLGGETAEMPGFYQDQEYDIAGFIVGIVDKKRVVDGGTIRAGDLLIGLPSTGLHTNGYSLARHVVFDQLGLTVNDRPAGFSRPIGLELLAIHRSYLKPVTALLKENLLKGMAHITGGGFLENIPRILPNDVSVSIQRTWPVLPIFEFLADKGGISQKECYRVFNMGIGMVLVIDKRSLSQLERVLKALGEEFYLIGQAVKSDGKTRVKIS